MGAWYTIGLFAGLGVAAGVFLAALLVDRRGGLVGTLVLATGVTIGVALLAADWPEAVGGAIGAVGGAVGAGGVVRGALGRGGTRAGTTMLLGGAALLLALLALIPFVGYVEAIVVPALGTRLRRRAGERYAGLRILARD